MKKDQLTLPEIKKISGCLLIPSFNIGVVIIASVRPEKEFKIIHWKGRSKIAFICILHDYI